MANITINIHNQLIPINHRMTNLTLNEFDQILPYLPTSLNTIIYYYTSDHTEDSFRDIIQQLYTNCEWQHTGKYDGKYIKIIFKLNGNVLPLYISLIPRYTDYVLADCISKLFNTVLKNYSLLYRENKNNRIYQKKSYGLYRALENNKHLISQCGFIDFCEFLHNNFGFNHIDYHNFSQYIFNKIICK